MSDIAKRVAYSTLYQTAGKIVSVVLGLVQVKLLVTHLDLAGYGQYQTVAAFLGIALVMSEFGLHITNVTNISKPGADQSRILSNAFTLRFLASLVVFAGAAVISYFFMPYDPVIRMGILAASTAFFALSINQIFVGVFQKNFANHILVFGEIVAKAIVIVAIIVLARFEAGVVAVLASLNIAWISYLAITMLFAYRYIPFSFAFDFSLWKKLLAESWPLAFSVILNLVYFRTDTIILSLYQDAIDVGIYNVPYKIIEVLLAFPLLFTGLLLPLLSRARESGDLGQFKKILQQGFNALAYVAILVVLETMIFAEPIVRLISTEEVFETAAALRLLIIATIFLFIGSLFGHAVPALGLQKKMIFGYLSAAITGLALYFALIPRISYYGAAIGTILTELVAAIFAAVLVSRKLQFVVSSRNVLKGVGIALLIALAWASYPAFAHVPWMISAGVIALVYASCLYATGAVSREDIRLLIPQRTRQ